MDYAADDFIAIKRHLAELEKRVDPKEAEKEAEPVVWAQVSNGYVDYTCFGGPIVGMNAPNWKEFKIAQQMAYQQYLANRAAELCGLDRSSYGKTFF